LPGTRNNSDDQNVAKSSPELEAEESKPTRSPGGTGSTALSSSGVVTGGSVGCRSNHGQRARGTYTGVVVSTAARYSTVQGSATAAARRSTAAAFRTAEARAGCGEYTLRRRSDVTEVGVRVRRDGLAIAGKGRRRRAGEPTRRGGVGQWVVQFSVTVVESVNNERFANLTDRRKLETTKAETVRPAPPPRIEMPVREWHT
jgi:hypothetical protein